MAVFTMDFVSGISLLHTGVAVPECLSVVMMWDSSFFPWAEKFNQNNSSSKFSWSWQHIAEILNSKDKISNTNLSRAVQFRAGTDQVKCSVQLSCCSAILIISVQWISGFYFSGHCTQSWESIWITSNLSQVDKRHYDVQLPLILVLSLLVGSVAFFLILWYHCDVLFYNN